ncbi:MAG: hypothetical protein IAE93_14520 [Ignavibacteria bacterium]|nr:hypothetical protein [Ignavibacteria bacterium]
MQNISTAFKAPLNLIPGSAAVRFFKYFKYEIIKVVIFLIFFFASLYYVNLESKEYYRSTISLVK